MSSHRALRKALQDQAFAPVYYFFGDDDFLKEEAVRQLVDRAVDPATRDFNFEVRRGGETDAETLDALLGTPPMMAERRVVVLRDVAGLKKDARGVLDRYLARPAADTVLVVVSPASAGAKADRGLEKAAVAVEYPLLTGDRVPKWIAHHATTHLQVTITPAAADLLHAAVGNDLPQLASELDKLASYVSGTGGGAGRGGEIDEAAVGDIVGIRRGETLGDLLDRIAERDVARALDLVPHVLSQPKTSAVTVVIALSTQMLALAWARAARDRGVSARALEGELFGLLKETGSHPFRPWGEAVRAWARAVDRWSPPQLDRALDALLDADCALKETRVSSEEQVLNTLVLALCAG